MLIIIILEILAAGISYFIGSLLRYLPSSVRSEVFAYKSIYFRILLLLFFQLYLSLNVISLFLRYPGVFVTFIINHKGTTLG